MSYIIVELSGGEVGVVLNKWLTPDKNQVFWPPYKDNYTFKKSLERKEQPNEATWALYPVARCLYESNNLLKAFNKQKRAELTSNLESDAADEDEVPVKRTIVRKKRYMFDDDSNLDSDEGVEENKGSKFGTIKPPLAFNRKLSFTNNTTRKDVAESSGILSSSKTYFNKNTPSFTDTTRKDVAESSGILSSSKTYFNKNTQTDELSYSTEVNNILMPHIMTIKEQNNQILASLRNKIGEHNSFENVLANIQLPLKSVDDLDSFEADLTTSKVNNLIGYLSSLGGDSTVSSTNRILKEIFDDNLAAQFNFIGKNNNKKPFKKLKINQIVLDSVKRKIKAATSIEVENAIKNWLKHAPTRLKLIREKNARLV